jgi:hypothetical protein
MNLSEKDRRSGVESGDYPITANAVQHCNGSYQFVSGGTGFLIVLAATGRVTVTAAASQSGRAWWTGARHCLK